LPSYVSSRAILCDNRIGENCFILEGANLQPFVSVGDNTVIWCSSHIGHHTVIGSHVFISSGVLVSGRCRIGDHCYLSGNSGVDANVTLAEGTLAGLQSVIKRDTEPWGIYTGHPARRRKISSADYEFL
jgi:UDP-3-O-[3-hydroxymyristoyl] glucosamine N-acyltransferase